MYIIDEAEHKFAIRKSLQFFLVNMLFVEIPCTAILAVYGPAIGLGRDSGYSQNVGGSVGLHIDSNTIFFLSWIGGIIFPLMLTASLTFVVVDARLCHQTIDRLLHKCKEHSLGLTDYMTANQEIEVVSKR